MAGTIPHEQYSSSASGNKPGKVWRSRTDRMIFGVCGGIGKYFGIDATLVRVLWVFGVFIGGSGILAYLIAAVLIPSEPEAEYRVEEKAKSDSSRLAALGGAVLILFGLIILFNTASWVQFPRMVPFYNFWHYHFGIFGPVILITIGILFVLMYFKKDLVEKNFILRSRTDRKIFGVCGGIGTYFHADPMLIRIFWVFFTFATGIFIGILIYIIFTVLLAEEPVPAAKPDPAPTGTEPQTPPNVEL